MTKKSSGVVEAVVGLLNDLGGMVLDLDDEAPAAPVESKREDEDEGEQRPRSKRGTFRAAPAKVAPKRDDTDDSDDTDDGSDDGSGGADKASKEAAPK